MKTKTLLPVILFGMLLPLAGLTSKSAQAQPGNQLSLQTFYDELSPYGEWINDEEYGYVWRPDVDQDFRPYYTNGRWIMTTYGNTWLSDYEWGWAPFHYGRWHQDRYNSWVWVPDTVWGPAWVSWRSGNGYYGWAPLMPRVNINISFGPRYYVPDPYWVFIPQRNIYSHFPRYYSHGRNKIIIRNTTIINNTYINNRNTYICGPAAVDVRRHTGQNVRVYNVAGSSRPGRARVSNNQVNIYRPSVTDRSGTSPRTVSTGTSRPRPAATTGPQSRNNTEPRSPENTSVRPRSENATPDRDRSISTSGRPVIKDERSERQPSQTQPEGQSPSRPRPQSADNSRERSQAPQQQQSSRPRPQSTEVNRERSEAPQQQRTERQSSRPRVESADRTSSGKQGKQQQAIKGRKLIV